MGEREPVSADLRARVEAALAALDASAVDLAGCGVGDRAEVTAAVVKAINAAPALLRALAEENARLRAGLIVAADRAESSWLAVLVEEPPAA